MRKKQNCGLPISWNGSISRMTKITCGLLFCLTTGAFATSENVELLTSNRIESAVPDQVGKTVTITVQDEMGPVVGANVVVKGTTNGNISDMDGKVILQNVPTNATLVVSYIGYITQEVKVGNLATINVKLVEDAKALEEVVVIGYGSLDKKQVTSAITSLKADDLMIGVSGADITTSLQGKISGLVMNNLGSANSGTTIQLRGMTSINSGKAPLIVIDGFPGGDIRSLTQEDIKSIDVLKDGSAAAIYGTRAASGVILITTKSGSDTSGKVKLSYSNEFSKKQNYNAPEMLTGREYAEHKIGTDYGSDTDWWDELLNKDNFSQKHHLALEMGTEKAQLYTSFFYEKNQGIAKQDERQDYGGRVNAMFKLFDDWLEVRPAVDYRQAKRNNHFPNFQQAMRNNPTRSPYDPDSETGYNVWTNESLDYNVVADAMLEDYFGLDKWFKPEVNLKLNIKPIEGLSYQQIVGYENRQWEIHQYWPSTHRSEIEESRKGQGYLGFSKTENLTSEGYFSYVKELKGGHSLNATAGYSYFETNGEGFNMRNYNFSVDGIKYWDMGQGSYLSDGKASMSSSKNVTERLFSLFARANYSYQDKYMASAAIRHEGSSKFASDNRWANSWSFGVGWNLHNEAFIKNLAWLKQFKLRASVGLTGNQNFDTNAALATYKYYTGISYGGFTGAYLSNMPNPKLKWEQKKDYNIGFDMRIAKLSLTFDYYSADTKNMLTNVSIPTSTGFAIVKDNLGLVRNSGVETKANYTVWQNKKGFFNVYGTFTYTKNKIIRLSESMRAYNEKMMKMAEKADQSAPVLMYQDGLSMNTIWAVPSAGIDPQSGNEIYIKKDGSYTYKYSANDMVAAGDATPKYRGTAGFTAEYNGFGLSATVSYLAGCQMYNSTLVDRVENADITYNVDRRLLQGRWTTPGQQTQYKKFNSSTRTRATTRFVQDRKELNLSSISAYYEFPSSIYQKLYMERLRLSFYINDIATFSSIKVERGLNYPFARTMSFSLNATF